MGKKDIINIRNAISGEVMYKTSEPYEVENLKSDIKADKKLKILFISIGALCSGPFLTDIIVNLTRGDNLNYPIDLINLCGVIAFAKLTQLTNKRMKTNQNILENHSEYIKEI